MNSWTYYLHQYFIDVQDPRTVDYPLAKEPFWKIALLLATYIITVKKLIPAVMKDRKPMQLRNVMFAYNIMMVFTNAFFFFFFISKSEYGKRLFYYKYPSIDYSEASLSYIYIFNFYWWSKFFDWLDTMFFALRKKDNHISFLHIYHHSIVPFFGYLFLKINPMVPGVILFGILNCFIHTVMYSYYALSSFGPSIQRFLWWKKYITQMQILQFVIFTIYALIFAFNQIGYPKFWLFFGYTQPPFFLYMFYDFYTRAYRSKKSHTN